MNALQQEFSDGGFSGYVHKIPQKSAYGVITKCCKGEMISLPHRPTSRGTPYGSPGGLFKMDGATADDDYKWLPLEDVKLVQHPNHSNQLVE